MIHRLANSRPPAVNTKMNQHNGAPAGPHGLAQDVGEFANDALTLAELQAQLFAADVQECSRRVLVPGLVLLSGIALGLACFPILLTALALWLAQALAISPAAGFLLAGLAGALLSAVLGLLGWIYVRQSAAVLGRSQHELARNLSWIKKVLQRSRISRTNRLDNSWRTVT